MKTVTVDPTSRTEWLLAMDESDTGTICVLSGATRFIIHKRKVLSSSGNPDMSVHLVNDGTGRTGREDCSQDRARDFHRKLSEFRCMSEDYRDELRDSGHAYDECDETGKEDSRRSRAKYE